VEKPAVARPEFKAELPKAAAPIGESAVAPIPLAGGYNGKSLSAPIFGQAGNSGPQRMGIVSGRDGRPMPGAGSGATSAAAVVKPATSVFDSDVLHRNGAGGVGRTGELGSAADALRAGQADALVQEKLYEEKSLAAGAAANAASAANGAGATGGGLTNSAASGFSGNFASAKFAGAKATVIGNRSLMLLKGDSFELTLGGDLISEVPGFVSGEVDADVYSSDGKVLVIELGSRLVAEFTQGMRQGQTRIPLIGSRVVTPHGVTVNIDSPGTDPLGGSGVPGQVDNHWPSRIGGSLLLALVRDAEAYASSRAQARSSGSGTSTNIYQQTQSSTDSLAGKLLDSTINRPPTITRRRGERIRVVLARDVDFSEAYSLVAKQ
jgi:type IV secretion system protein VirB10